MPLNVLSNGESNLLTCCYICQSHLCVRPYWFMLGTSSGTDDATKDAGMLAVRQPRETGEDRLKVNNCSSNIS